MQSINIIESYIQGKRPDQSLCEDGYVVTPHFAAVVDGSTSKVEGRNGGREAMRLVVEAIGNLPPEAGKESMLQTLTQVLARHNPTEALTDAAWRLTCSTVIYSRARSAVWMVGDCQCRFGGTTHTNPKLIDTILTQVRCDVVRHLLSRGHTPDDIRRNDLGRAFIMDALHTQTNFQNDPNPLNPYAYPVLDGTPVRPDRVLEIPVSPETDSLILASDGYPIVGDTLAESERALQQMLHEDPLCIGQNAGTKCLVSGNHSFDDRCYLRLSLP